MNTTTVLLSSYWNTSWNRKETSIFWGCIMLVAISIQAMYGFYSISRTMSGIQQSPQPKQQSKLRGDILMIQQSSYEDEEQYQNNVTSTQSMATTATTTSTTTPEWLSQQGWMSTISDMRFLLSDAAAQMDTVLEMESTQTEFNRQVQHYGNYTFDISVLYDAVVDVVDTVGVRGLLFDVLNDQFDYYLYYPDPPNYPCTVMHGVGAECGPTENWWIYHYTGATIADHFLESLLQPNEKNTDRGILWDGSTGQRLTNIRDLIREIQNFQQLPYVNSASFHAEHAIIWQYLTFALPDMMEYPTELADSFCAPLDSQVVMTAAGANKGINHECYHGFGHAMFYTVAKRQLIQQMDQAKAKNKTNKTKTQDDDTTKDIPLPTTTPPLSARFQVRHNSGYELTPEAMCQVYQLCKDAKRGYLGEQDQERRYPFSKGVRVCLEGVVHSVRLFSDTRHDKQEAIDYVNEEMQRCAREAKAKKHDSSSSGSSIIANDIREDTMSDKDNGEVTSTNHEVSTTDIDRPMERKTSFKGNDKHQQHSSSSRHHQTSFQKTGNHHHHS